MKKTITLFAAALLLCCLNASAQIAYISSADWGNQNGCASNGSTSTQITIPTGTTEAVFVVIGDLITGGHDDVTGTGYGTSSSNTALTLVDKWTGPDGSHSNNRYMYMWKMNNASSWTGLSDYFSITCSSSHLVAGVVAFYSGASDVKTVPEGTGGQHILFGPSSNYIGWATTSHTDVGFAWPIMAVQGTNPVATENDTLRKTEHTDTTPTIIDSNLGINPPRYWEMAASWASCCLDDARIAAELVPSTTTAQFGALVSTPFTASNSWDYTAANSNLGSCDYSASAWDTTTTPYTQLTPTSNSCDGSYNVTLGFSANHTGVMVIVPNPNKCGTGTC